MIWASTCRSIGNHPAIRPHSASTFVYAIGAGLKVADSLAMEKADSEAGQTYANILVVKEGNENNEAVKALMSLDLPAGVEIEIKL